MPPDIDSSDDLEDLDPQNRIPRNRDPFGMGQSDQAQLSLLRSGENSDVQITCQGRTWAVHSVILAPRCAFFRGALRPRFQEQSRGIINLDEDDPEAIAEMLKYLYTLSDKLEVRRGTVLHPLGESELLHNVNHLAGVIVTAEKYGISTLAALAGEKLDWQLSDIEIPRAAKEAKKQICDLSDALYSRDPTPRLRWYQKRLTRMLLVRIFEPITKVPGLKEVIDMHPQFGWDLLESTCEELEYQRQMNRNMREKKDLTMQP